MAADFRAQGWREHRFNRVKGMTGPIEETFWTAKAWAESTRIPYRAILSAASRGELAAVRPSGAAKGTILISETSWAEWIEAIRLQVRVPGRVEAPRVAGRARSLVDLELR